MIIIVSVRDGFTWPIQEMSGASFSDKPLIVLVEEGADFKPGVLGDLEYIKFLPAHIASCFVPIAEGLRELGFKFH